MGKTEGIFLNLQCDCHRVASMFIKLINLYSNFSTLLPNVTALWINGVSLNSLRILFSMVRTSLIEAENGVGMNRSARGGKCKAL